jgi:hypothetical protein
MLRREPKGDAVKLDEEVEKDGIALSLSVNCEAFAVSAERRRCEYPKHME